MISASEAIRIERGSEKTYFVGGYVWTVTSPLGTASGHAWMLRTALRRARRAYWRLRDTYYFS